MRRDFQSPSSLPPEACEIVCVRHGTPETTSGNRGSGLLNGGSGGPPLSADGRAQAEAVAEYLSDVQAVRLFVTPLRRTQETAEPLVRRTALQPEVITDLREVNLGDWDGEFTARMVRDDPSSADLLAAGRWDAIPNAEDMDDFSARVRAGMNEMAVAAGPDRVAIAVLHGGIIAEACRQATGSRPFAFLYCDNASISRLQRLANGHWTLVSFNETAHLRKLVATPA